LNQKAKTGKEKGPLFTSTGGADKFETNEFNGKTGGRIGDGERGPA